ncbi:MAG: SDR family oxidoreductase [Hyphomicrobiales bacterium]
MKVLVLGAYGLIGAAVTQRLLANGHDVTGLGRDIARARRFRPRVTWIAGDIARMTSPGDWAGILRGMEVVVNAAGALQDGARDDVAALQQHAMIAMYAAAREAGVRRVVQVSATGASPDASTAFLRTKAAADAALAGSGLEHVILRPGMVIGPGAYGGSALLRALASFPLILPLAYADSPLRTVALDDVAGAVLLSVNGEVPSGTASDLVELEPRGFAGVVAAMRGWLGFPPAPVVRLPGAVALPVALACDGLGWLGWRPPLRSTAIRSIRDGVDGDPTQWGNFGGLQPRPLEQTLAAGPAGAQDRWFARMWLMKPVLIGSLAAFWIATGLVTACNDGAAARILTARGIGEGTAAALVWGGVLADVLLGCAVLVRPWARSALQGMIALTLAYLVSGTVLTPELWADPLGPLVKALLVPVLALAALAVLEER